MYLFQQFGWYQSDLMIWQRVRMQDAPRLCGAKGCKLSSSLNFSSYVTVKYVLKGINNFHKVITSMKCAFLKYSYNWKNVNVGLVHIRRYPLYLLDYVTCQSINCDLLKKMVWRQIGERCLSGTHFCITEKPWPCSFVQFVTNINTKIVFELEYLMVYEN